VLAAADEASKKAKAAYEEAVRQLQQSLTGLERENRQAASSAPPGADRSAVGGQLSELTVRLELASAHCGLGQLLWTLADNAEMVVQVGQLLATVGQAGPPGIEISAAETRQAAKTSYAAAYPILEAAGSNPLVRRSEQSSLWAKTIERRLAFVQTRAGDALGAVSPGGPPASRGPVPGAP